MKPHWKKCKLGEVADVIMGQSPPSSTYNEEKIGLPFYQGVVDFNDRFVSERVYCSEPKKVLEANDILLSVRAPVGRVNISKSMCSIGRGNAGLRMKNGEQTFLYNLLKHYNKQLHSSSSGTVFSSINKSTIENLPISLPPLAEQKAIARILGSLDDKIELNRQMNRTLEEMAQAIFKAWFVDYVPFKDGNFINSELGMIPEGWRVGKLGDISNISSGKRPGKRNKERSSDYPFPLYGGAGVMAYVKEPMELNECLLTGRVGTLGEVFRITEKCWPSDNTLLIEPLKQEYFDFFYFTLKRIDFYSLNRGSTQPLVTQSDLMKQKLVLPKEIELKKFDKVVNPIFEKILSNRNEIETLTQTRDTLLPKLLSGEIGVN